MGTDPGIIIFEDQCPATPLASVQEENNPSVHGELEQSPLLMQTMALDQKYRFY